MAIFLRRPEAETTETHGELGRSQRVVWQRCVRKAEEGGQTSGDGVVVLTSIISRLLWRQDPQQVIGAGRRAVPQQQPGRLQVVNGGDALQEAVLCLALEAELVLDKRVCSQRRAQNREALLVPRQRPVPHPDRVADFSLEAFDALAALRRQSSRCVFYPG